MLLKRAILAGESDSLKTSIVSFLRAIDGSEAKVCNRPYLRPVGFPGGCLGERRKWHSASASLVFDSLSLREAFVEAYLQKMTVEAELTVFCCAVSKKY